MPLLALVIDGITTSVQVATLSHGIVSIRVVQIDEIVNTFIFLFLSCLSYCDLLHRLAWLLIISSVSILFEMITNVQHRPISNRSNRFSDWLRYLYIPMVHPVSIDCWCLVLLLYKGYMVQSSSTVV